MSRHLTLLVLLPLVLLLAAPATAAAPTADQAIYVGVYLHDISRFDQKNGAFDADFELWAKWRGTFDRESILIGNAANVERIFLGEDVDGTWHSARWRVRGTLRGEFPLQRFPFDEQSLAVVLDMPERYGHLVPDLASSGMAEKFSLSDWLYKPVFQPRISSEVYESDLGNLTHEGQKTVVGRVAFQVTMIRPIAPVLLKLFLPMVIIAMVALGCLFIHPEMVDARSAMGVTALLSCFAFQFTVSDSLPAVAYLTLADRLFLVGYVVATLVIVETIVAYALVLKEKTKPAMVMDRVFQVAIPVVAGLVVWTSIPKPLPPSPRMVQELPDLSHEDSSRDTLRMGTGLLNRILGTPTSFGSNWDLIYDDPDLGRLPIFVEQVPSVSSDALRFLAGGKVEVTWRLREGLVWSDGVPVTAADIRIALEASPNENIESVTSPSDSVVVILWNDRLAQALDPPYVWPDHKVRAVFEALDDDGKKGGYDAVQKMRKNEPLPTLGPYMPVSFEKKKKLVAQANPHFIGPPPAIGNVEIIWYESGTAALAAFEAGEIDMMTPNTITLEQAVDLATRQPDAVSVGSSGFHILLHPDIEHPALKKVDVRRAILMAIDRQAIADEVYGGFSDVAHIPVPGALPEDTVITPYDPAGARALLRASGANRITLPLKYAKSETSKQIADVIERNLAAVGIRVEREAVKSTLKLWRARGHGGLVLHVQRNRRSAVQGRYWNLPTVDGVHPPDYRHDAYDDEIHGIIQRERRALYPERRAQLQDKLFVEASRRLPNLPMVWAAQRSVVDPALEGWEVDDVTVAYGKGIEKWHFVDPEPEAPAAE
jgi:ABC-type transport system substrate-binding protein